MDDLLTREDTGEYAILKDLLVNGETVGLEVVERRLGGARILWPVHAYATSKRVVFIRKHLMGAHTVKMVQYEDITEVMINRSLLFSKIHLAVIGEKSESKNAWMIGIGHEDAIAFIRYVNGMMDSFTRQHEPSPQ